MTITSTKGANMMKKLFMLTLSASLLSIIACGEKKGTIEGVVLDAFTGKPVEMPTVWMDSTIFSTQKPKYEFKGELQKGQFKFVNVPVGDYLIKARRNRYVLGQEKFTTSDASPDLKLTLYIYNDQVDPGLYKAGAEGAEKISNNWVLWSASCKESVAGYRLSYVDSKEMPSLPNDKKSKKKNKKKAAPAGKEMPLPAPGVVDANIDFLYKNASSVTAPLMAASYPVEAGNVASHTDCDGFNGDKKGLFANASKKVDLEVAYKSESLYQIKGTLPKGKQVLVLSQDGKTLQTYYFEVK